ncbi:hypothetical protein ElyMa_000269900 [Elysia marginata]|uniref:Uncharacterized protein n=1 Tax=Elysia marginata TaxID=1093978 RepID=A0AAV4F758_9GAST|nr:hypothetical protein ElyMa_000269900 [Elysia marginata]
MLLRGQAKKVLIPDPRHEFEDKVGKDTDGFLNNEDSDQAEIVDEVTERVIEEPGGATRLGYFRRDRSYTFSYAKEESKDAGTGMNGNNQSHETAQDFGQFGGFDRDQETAHDIAFETGEKLPCDLREALEHFNSIMNRESQTKPSIVFDRVKQQLCKTKTRMADHRTSKLWL